MCPVTTSTASVRAEKACTNCDPVSSPPAIVTIGHDAADQHEQQNGQLAEEAVESQVEIRLREIEHEPALGVALHPRADGRSQGGQPEEAVVAVGEGPGQAVRQGAGFLGLGLRTPVGSGHSGDILPKVCPCTSLRTGPILRSERRKFSENGVRSSDPTLNLSWRPDGSMRHWPGRMPRLA